MPSKELKTRRAIAHERDREQRHMTSQKSSSFQELQACTLRFSARLLPDSCDADVTTPTKSDPEIYSFFTIRCIFSACRVKPKEKLRDIRSMKICLQCCCFVLLETTFLQRSCKFMCHIHFLWHFWLSFHGTQWFFHSYISRRSDIFKWPFFSLTLGPLFFRLQKKCFVTFLWAFHFDQSKQGRPVLNKPKKKIGVRKASVLVVLNAN